MSNWGLIVLLVIVVAYFFWARRPVKGIQNITADALVEEIKTKGNALSIVDVREPFEFSSGHIAKARNIPLGSLSKRLKELSPDGEIVFVCRSGNRSMQAAKIAKKEGYKAVYNLTGGMSRWTGPVKK
ncbi:rhodanese-like domain-containing protein [Alicyclobacillus tolerans]|uniref:rhodanese-like domain-containing protein n=1 Tax=Alicyclobacillus tolerans TaxID=90970 RepID=UPI001F248A69|nr:rhodanese-like domain-containing protein [Alicyclobacillus tolerans]MCF8563423.1 rhodanese-like domain-containing protein [Alicyclobacillus tolerans]